MTAPHPLLVALARGAPLPAVGHEDALVASAIEHRMVGALLAAQAAGSVRLSRDGATALGVWDLDERRSHLRFWRTIDEVEDRLRPVGAEVAVLKGVATEARWYDGLGERATTDVDLLLSPAAIPRIGEVVSAIAPDHPAPATVARLAGRGLLQHVDLVVDGVAVDLHLDPFKVGVPIRSMAQVWDRTGTVDGPHGPVRVLATEDELTLLLLHLNKDRFAYLGPHVDVARIVERGRVDWGAMRALVAGEGLDVPVWCSLAAVAETLDLRVPVPAVHGPRARSWTRIWGPGARLGGHEGRARAVTVQPALALHVRRRPADVARELRRQVLPQRELLEWAGRLEPDGSHLRALWTGWSRRARGAPPR